MAKVRLYDLNPKVQAFVKKQMPSDHKDPTRVYLGDVNWDEEKGELSYKVSWTGYDGVYHPIVEKTKDYDDETRKRILKTIENFEKDKRS